jgi:hypothetical protein
MLWFNFLPMTPSYSIYSPNYQVWDSWSRYDRPAKWGQGFITNTPKKELDTRMVNYEKAAKAVGVKIRVEDEAYDIKGRIVPNCSAIFIDEAAKRSSFWQALDELQKPKTSFLIQGVSKPELVIAKCNCSMMTLMRSGCKCNGA